MNKVYLKVDCESYSYASGLSAYEHDKIRASAKALGKSKRGDIGLQQARIKLSKERDEFHARNSRRRTQVTASKAARSEKIGVSDVKLVIDNSKKVLNVDSDHDQGDLSLEGWSVD